MVITGRTFNRIKDFINRFEEMNFVGDTVVEEQLKSFRKEFLDVFETSQVREDPELQEELTRRLRLISQAAMDTTDVSEITGAYSRRVLFNRDNDGTAN
jgi:cell division FtsZ-interacting protein ZapD